MNQFDSYLPAAWQHDGLTIRPPVHSLPLQTSSKRSINWKVLLTTTIISVSAAAVLSFSFPAAAMKASEFQIVTTAGEGRNAVNSEVPFGYWPRLVTELRNAPTLPDDLTFSDPDPIV